MKQRNGVTDGSNCALSTAHLEASYVHRTVTTFET